MKYEDVLEVYFDKITGPNQRLFWVEKLELGMQFSFMVRSYHGNVKACFTKDTFLLWLNDAKVAISYCFPSAWYDRTNVISISIVENERGCWMFDDHNGRKFYGMQDEVPEEWEVELMRPFRGGNDHDVSGYDE